MKKNHHAVSLGKLGGRPRATLRCPCGANAITRAASRSFDCCKKAGILAKIIESVKDRAQ